MFASYVGQCRPWYIPVCTVHISFKYRAVRLFFRMRENSNNRAHQASTTSTMAISTTSIAASLTNSPIVGPSPCFFTGSFSRRWQIIYKKSRAVDHNLQCLTAWVHYEKRTFAISYRRTSPSLPSTTLLVRPQWPLYSANRRIIYPTSDGVNFYGHRTSIGGMRQRPPLKMIVHCCIVSDIPEGCTMSLQFRVCT